MLKDLSLAQEGRVLCGEEWIFLQNIAAIHSASVTKKYLLEQKIRLLDHPAGSPIENLRGLIVAKIYGRGRQCTAVSELKNAVFVELQKLVDSMPCRIF